MAAYAEWYLLLQEFERDLPQLLMEPDRWTSLDVNYEPPRVERLWMERGDFRYYLHRIHPCEHALFHPHPWPSAIKIVSGSYEMGVGYHTGHIQPEEACQLRLTAGSTYVMIDKDGWHRVRPLDEPSLSIMVTGPRWDRWSPKPGFKLDELSREARDQLIEDFKQHYPLRP